MHDGKVQTEMDDLQLKDEVTFRHVSPAIEFCCWVVLGLAPFLRWVNGAAVTADQFVIQIGIVSTAAIGAVGLRIYNWRTASPGGQPVSPSVNSE